MAKLISLGSSTNLNLRWFFGSLRLVLASFTTMPKSSKSFTIACAVPFATSIVRINSATEGESRLITFIAFTNVANRFEKSGLFSESIEIFSSSIEHSLIQKLCFLVKVVIFFILLVYKWPVVHNNCTTSIQHYTVNF